MVALPVMRPLPTSVLFSKVSPLVWIRSIVLRCRLRTVVVLVVVVFVQRDVLLPVAWTASMLYQSLLGLLC